MKSIGLFFIVLGMCVSANAEVKREEIKQQMENEHVGEVIRPSDIQGQYVGSCYEGSFARTEALYVGAFINAQGSIADLAISTAQTYGGASIPASLSFLLTPDQTALNFIKNLVAQGFSGTDNNLEEVGPGKDFKFLYTSNLDKNTLTVKVQKYYECSGACSPPLLQACSYGYDEGGNQVFSGCLRNNDQTVFKKVSDTKLISHRTADSLGKKTNNLSFYRAPISTFCEWVKK